MNPNGIVITESAHKKRIDLFPLNQIIKDSIDKRGVKMCWIAQQIHMPYSTLTGKLAKNTFTAIELLEIAAVINIDLNDWRSLAMEYIKKIS